MKAVASPESLDALGEYALRFVKPGFRLGLGTGHAASAFIRALGKSGMKVRGVPTSHGSEMLARECGIEVVSLSEVDRLDVAIDGADEVDPRLNLIKGLGGALVREKIVAESARKFVVVAGVEKIVKRLGEHGILPVEVVPFASSFCARRIRALGLRPKTRLKDDGSEFLSDNGNLIFDCAVKPIANAVRLDRDLRAIPGVVGTGIFPAIADRVLIANADGSIRVLNRPKPR